MYNNPMGDQTSALMSSSATICPLPVEERVRAVIDRVRPYIQSHGGDVWVSGIKAGVVTLKIDGACTHCPLANQTYNKMVGALIGEEVPEITDIVLT